MKNHSRESERVLQYFEEHRTCLVSPVMELDSSTRTASDAARTLGCSLGQIASSIVLATSNSNLLLVISSGYSRICLETVGSEIGETVSMAKAVEIKRRTGFAVGGVAPVAHLEPLQCFIDIELFDYSEVWCAAGTPRAVFSIAPLDLEAVSSARKIRVR